jgi:hypothetical protein
VRLDQTLDELVSASGVPLLTTRKRIATDLSKCLGIHRL